LFVVVLLELDPDSYVVVAVEVYPPSIAVLDPDVLVCVDPAITAAVIQPDNNSKSIINVIGFFIIAFLDFLHSNQT
jgi:Pyruvate/2-oxoacid:ferredoxin oxidoreductase gamma subunit